MTVDAEREKVEAQIEAAEALLTGEDDPEQEIINSRLVEMYERLDDLDVSKVRAMGRGEAGIWHRRVLGRQRRLGC